jgi:PKHD-type hydroxylase
MLLTIADAISSEDVADVHKSLKSGRIVFHDGSATAGWAAKSVKRNQQATGPALDPLLDAIRKQLMGHAVFVAAAQPKLLVGVMLSRYLPGMAYGTHVDNALMAGVRTDLSFTLFLSDPESYEGGALVIEGNGEEQEVKLQAGSLVLYPTTSLHRVNEVTRGDRLAIVGWIRSFIRSDGHRETLFDLENAIATLRIQNADRALLNQLLKVRTNLQRGWVED